MFRLTLSFSGQPVRKYNFEKESVTIGRDVECDVLIDNIGCSRTHATIERSNGDYILKDLKSHNGTFVRGERIFSHKLDPSDEFFIGKYSVAFENLDVDEDLPRAPVEALQSKLAGMQDMTFRLDTDEIKKLMGASASEIVPKLAQIAPERESRTMRLEEAYYLIGADKRCRLRIGGLNTPWIAAAILRDEKKFQIVALTKKSRVQVNGQKVIEQTLADGDTIRIGRRKFRYSLR